MPAIHLLPYKCGRCQRMFRFRVYGPPPATVPCPYVCGWHGVPTRDNEPRRRLWRDALLSR